VAKSLFLAVAGLLAMGAALPPAASNGRLMTLTVGRYQCERPGAQGGQAIERDPAASFAVVTSSRYVAADGTRGTYLFTGDTVTMTSGPLAGTRLVRIRESFLRRLEANGLPGEMRCVLSRSSDRH